MRAFIAWLGVAYLWLLVTLWLRHDRFAVGGFVCALGFLVTVNLLNPDADPLATTWPGATTWPRVTSPSSRTTPSPP